MKLVTIDYIQTNNKPYLVIFCRVGKNRERITISDFKPYFYRLASEKKPEKDFVIYKTIFGEDVVKVFAKVPGDVLQLRKNFDYTGEADVHFPTRFLIDCVPKIEKSELRIQYTDIEKDTETNRIISISVYDNYLQKCVAFAWRNDLEEKQYNIEYSFPSGYSFKATIHLYNSRKRMFKAYLGFIHDSDPDILTGWFFIRYDMKELIQEINSTGLKASRLSPINRAYIIGDEVGRFNQNIAVKGRVLWDMLKAYKWLQPSRLPDASLEAIAQKELGEGKVKRTMSFHELWKKDIEQLIEYNCLLPQELIITVNGVKPIKEIKQNELVLTHNGKYEKVKRSFKRNYQGDIVSIKVGNFGKIQTTPEHPILVLGKKKFNKNVNKIWTSFKAWKNKDISNRLQTYIPIWKKAETLSKNDVVLYPILQAEKDLKEVIVPEMDNYYHWLLKEGKRKKNPFFKFKDKIILNNKALLFFGLYAGDGYSNKGRFSLSLNSEKDDIELWCKAFAETFGTEPYKYKNKKSKAMDLYRNCKPIAKFLKNSFGSNSYNKHLPSWIMNLPKNKLKSVINGLILSDGHIRKDGLIIFVTTSPTLAEQYKQLLLKTGILPHCYKIKPKLKNRALIYRICYNPKQEYSNGYLDDKFAYLPIRKIYKKSYIGNVYNLAVEEDESFATTICATHNCKDSVLVYRIDQKKRLLEYFDELRRFIGCEWNALFSETLLWDVYILRKVHNKLVLPTKEKIIIPPYQGATVFEPASKGIHKNILLIDLKSLYPSIIITYNMSPERLYRGESPPNPNECYILPNGVAFYKKPIGLLPTILLELFERRKKLKLEMKKFPYGTSEYETLYNQQEAIKILCNALYGSMGYFNFRLATPEIASTIPFVGRKILEFIRDQLKKEGYNIIAGDTDSIFYKSKEEDLSKMVDEMFANCRTINDLTNIFIKDFGGSENSYIKIEPKKIYSAFMISEKKSGKGRAKKRYAGITSWADGEYVDINSKEALHIMGFEAKRSDSSELSRKVQRQVIKMLLMNNDIKIVKTYVNNIIDHIKNGGYDLEHIGIPKGLSMPLHKYKTDNPHRRGAIYSNHYLGTKFGMGDKPRIIYVMSCGKYPKTDVICFNQNEDVPKDFKMDVDKMIQKTVIMKIEHILDTAGLTIENILYGTSSLEDFF